LHKNLTLRTTAAVIISLLVCILAYNFLQTLKQEVSIVVAKNEIDKGMIIKEEDLEIIKMRKKDSELFPNSVSIKEEIVGAITKDQIRKNTPIEKTPDLLVYDNERTIALNQEGKVNESYFIPEGMRVVAIELDAVGSLNYSLEKGQFVDVIYTSTDESAGGLYSSMLLQHMEIFDIEEVTVESDGMLSKKQRVMLLATPEESLKVAVGNRNGVLDLALNPLYGTTENIDPVNILSFSAEPPSTKEESLRIVESYIKEQNITTSTKEKLLNLLEKEKDIQTLISVIEGSNIDDKQKKILLESLK
jgi:Flp pilus assembly protein CpaB